jgi:regulator of sigma E protease
MTFLIALITTAVVLGIMILIHEFGHYAVAKYFGVRVEVFSIGFGKRLAGFTKGDTDYRISALPFGGYVKMAGENPMEDRTGAPDEFQSHPRWQRFFIALAGPVMNIGFAVILLAGAFMVHYEHDAFMDQPAVVGDIIPNTAASKAGVIAGDRIIRVEGVQNPTWEDVILKTMLNARNPVDLAIQRNGQILNIKLTPEPKGQQEFGYTGLVPDQQIIATYVDDTMPAYRAGLRIGDEIEAINGQHMASLPAIQRYLKENGQKPVDVQITRASKLLDLKGIVPVPAELDNGERYYRLGFTSNPTHVDRLPIGKAFKKSIEQNTKYGFLVIELVQKMATREVSIKQVDGPIGIGKAAGEAIRQPGWIPIVLLMAAISLNLGVFNLLPFPILDGGLILMLAIEGLMRRDINQRLKERIYQTAFVFLILFAALVIYNDVAKLGLTKFFS